MGRLPLIIGAGALMAYAYSRTTKHRRTRVAPSSLPGRWVWPVKTWNGRVPVISDGFGSPRPGGITHQGVDIMFRREPSDSLVAGTPNGSKLHVMPDGVHALAATDGFIWSAMQAPRGWTVVIDHSPLPYATFYTHLERLLVPHASPSKNGHRVLAGTPIGIIGGDPLVPPHLKHLHFELWMGGPKDAVDPAALMRTWPTVGESTLVARNAGFTYRPVGASGEPYPEWVRALKGESGVYIIREQREVVYVGSSVGRLYDTLTRHFQQWRRYKGFWRGQYGAGHDPGLTYKRDRVEVAVRITRPSEALDEEARLIQRLRPRDNLLGQPVEEVVPF